jgi:hypothetical protein
MNLRFGHSAIAITDNSPSLHFAPTPPAKTSVQKSALFDSTASSDGFNGIEFTQKFKVIARQSTPPLEKYYGIVRCSRQTGNAETRKTDQYFALALFWRYFNPMEHHAGSVTYRMPT